MAEISLPEDLTTIVRDLDRRVRALEVRPQTLRRAGYGPTQTRTNTGSSQAFPNGPSVTATIGPSRQALVTINADIGLNVVNQTGLLSVSDGSTWWPAGWLSVSSSNSDTIIAGRVGSTILTYNLNPGDVTFTAGGYVSTGSVNYSNIELSVQPL